MALPDASHITSLNEAVVHLKAVSLEDIPTVYISSLRSNKHGIYTYRPSIYIYDALQVARVYIAKNRSCIYPWDFSHEMKLERLYSTVTGLRSHLTNTSSLDECVYHTLSLPF